MARASVLGSTAKALAIFIAAVAAAQLGLSTRAEAQETYFIDGPFAVGRGLQEFYAFVLSQPAPAGGVEFTLSSQTTQDCLLAPNDETAGSATLVVTVPEWNRRGSFVTQSLRDAVGGVGYCQVQVAVDPAGWVGPSNTILANIVDAQLRVRGLRSRHGTLDRNDPFAVQIGVAVSGSGISFLPQGVTFGETPCDVMLCSDAPAVGTIVNGAGVDVGNDGCEAVQIKPPSDLSKHGLIQFDPDPNRVGATGPVNVTATSACGLDGPRSLDVVDETVSPRGPSAVGAHLQVPYRARLTSPAPTTGTILVESLTTDKCKVAESERSAGEDSVTPTIFAGQFSVDFVVQGIAVGDCDVRTSTDLPLFVATTERIDVEEPAVRISGLQRSFEPTDANDSFELVIGLTGRGKRTVVRRQAARFVGGGLSDPNFEVSSENPAVGQIAKDGISAPKQNVPVPEGTDRSGEVGFDPISDGKTVVEAERVGFITTDAGRVTVEVTTTTVDVGDPRDLGAGLEEQYTLQTSRKLGSKTDFEVGSDHPSRCSLSVLETALGQESIIVTVPKGRSRADFYVHAEPADSLATCELTITTQPGGDPVANGRAAIPIIEPGLQIVQLPGSLSTADPDESFFVRIGVPSSKGRTVSAQTLRSLPSGETLEDLLVCSSEPSVAALVGAGAEPPSNCVLAPVNPNDDRTADLLLAPGTVGEKDTTTISVSAPGFRDDIPAAEKDVRVSDGAIKATGLPGEIGKDLQDTYTLKITPKAQQGPVTVELTATDDDPEKVICELAPSESEGGGNSLPVTIEDGKSTKPFTVIGLQTGPNDDPARCIIQATTTSEGYPDTEFEFTIVKRGVRFRELESTAYPGAPADPFLIEVGPPNGTKKDLRAAQSVRALFSAPEGLLVRACVDDVTKAEIVGLDTGDPKCKEAHIAPGQASTAETALGFLPLMSPSVTVAAEADDSVTASKGRVEVTIEDLVVSVEKKGLVDRVAKGLMDAFQVKTSQAVVTATPVNLTAAPAAVCQVSALEGSTPGTTDTITIAKGKKIQTFQVHGVKIGQCTVTAEIEDLASDSLTIPIVEASGKIAYLADTKSRTASSDPFRVVIGVRKEDLLNLQWNQKVSTTTNGLDLTVCSSNPAVGLIYTDNTASDPSSSPTTAECSVITIAPKKVYTPLYKLKFDPIDIGTTTVFIKEPEDLFPIVLSTHDVEVTP